MARARIPVGDARRRRRDGTASHRLRLSGCSEGHGSGYNLSPPQGVPSRRPEVSHVQADGASVGGRVLWAFVEPEAKQRAGSTKPLVSCREVLLLIACCTAYHGFGPWFAFKAGGPLDPVARKVCIWRPGIIDVERTGGGTIGIQKL